MGDKEQLKEMREKLYTKARKYRIDYIMCDIDKYKNEKLYGIINGESKFLWANSKFSNKIGWSVYEIISMPLNKLIHPDDLNTVDNLASLKKSIPSLIIRMKVKGNGFQTLNLNCVYIPEKNCVYCYSND